MSQSTESVVGVEQQIADFGPTLLDDGVTFRVFSPGARNLALQLHPGTPDCLHLPLERSADGFWRRHVEGIGAATRYLLQRDQRAPQPDPASHFQPEGVFGPSEVIDFDAYRWRSDDWRGVAPEALVLYEVHVGTFSPEGSYEGLRGQLDKLADSGITGLKLMPLAAWAGRHNWGYDGVFHLAPFAGYGRPEALQRLVDDCHAQGIALLVDVVSNHFGPEGNAMWTMARGFFHKHTNTAWGPGPRFDREPALAYFQQMAWHLARRFRVDGLRVDAVHAIAHPGRRPHLERMARGLAAGAKRGTRLHLMLESADNESSLLFCEAPNVTVSQLDFDYQRAAHRLLTGERHMEYAEADDDGDALCSCLGRGFSLAGDYSAQRQRVVGEPTDALSWSQLVNYLMNHDTAGNRYLGQRLNALVDAQRFRAATALLLLHPATPYLLMGQEWASQRRFHFFTDFPEALGRRVERGRLAGFHELDVAKSAERAPGPQDPEAFERSHLDRSEADSPACAVQRAFTKDLLALRRELRPQMENAVSATSARRVGSTFFVDIPRRDGRGSFRIVANLGCATVALESEGELRYSSEPLNADGRLPALATCLLVRAKGPLKNKSSK